MVKRSSLMERAATNERDFQMPGLLHGSMNSFRLCFAVVTGAFLSGCALTTDRVTLQHTPDPNPPQIAGAKGKRVAAEVKDERTVRDRVSVKKNGYGMEMAPIVASNDVPQFVKQAIEKELANRGFSIGQGGTVANIQLLRFYSDFKVGFWSGDAVAEVDMMVAVRGYTRHVNGLYKKGGVMLASGGNAKEALEAALTDAISKLLNDKAFVDTLVRGG